MATVHTAEEPQYSDVNSMISTTLPDQGGEVRIAVTTQRTCSNFDSVFGCFLLLSWSLSARCSFFRGFGSFDSLDFFSEPSFVLLSFFSFSLSLDGDFSGLEPTNVMLCHVMWKRPLLKKGAIAIVHLKERQVKRRLL